MTQLEKALRHPDLSAFLVGQVGIEPTVFLCHGFTDRCNRQLCVLTHVAESAEFESDTTNGTVRLAGGLQSFRVHSPN